MICTYKLYNLSTTQTFTQTKSTSLNKTCSAHTSHVLLCSLFSFLHVFPSVMRHTIFSVLKPKTQRI